MSHRRFIQIAGLLVGFFALATPTQAATSGGSATTNLAKKINLDLWNKNLGDGHQQITSRSHFDIIVSPASVLPKDFPAYKLFIEGKQIPTRIAIEWLSRSVGMRYRITGKHAALITGSYDWMKDLDRKMIVEHLDSFVDPDSGVKELKRDIFELVKVYSLFPNFTLRIETDQESVKLVGSLPKTLKDRLKRGLLAMSKRGQPIFPPPTASISPAEVRMLKKLQNPVIVRYKNQGLHEILIDIARQSGFGIAIDPRLFLTRPLPKISLNIGVVPTRKAIEAVMKKADIAGVEIYPGGGLWFTAMPHKWVKAASREIVWEKMAVRSYDCRALAESLGGGESIAHYICSTVSPDTWLDPSTAVIYHERSGNLIVFAPEKAQLAVHWGLVKLSRSQHRKATSPRSPRAARWSGRKKNTGRP